MQRLVGLGNDLRRHAANHIPVNSVYCHGVTVIVIDLAVRAEIIIPVGIIPFYCVK